MVLSLLGRIQLTVLRSYLDSIYKGVGGSQRQILRCLTDPGDHSAYRTSFWPLTSSLAGPQEILPFPRPQSHLLSDPWIIYSENAHILTLSA